MIIICQLLIKQLLGAVFRQNSTHSRKIRNSSLPPSIYDACNLCRDKQPLEIYVIGLCYSGLIVTPTPEPLITTNPIWTLPARNLGFCIENIVP